MLSPTRKVRRQDGSKVAISVDISWGQEFRALLKHIQRRKVSELMLQFDSEAKRSLLDLAYVFSRILLLLLRRNPGNLSLSTL